MPWGTPNVGTIASGSGTSVVVSVPAGVQDGDILLAHICKTDDFSTITAPAGWTLVQPGESTLNEAAVYVRVASSEPASYTWTLPSPESFNGVIVALNGGDSATPIDASAVSTNSSGGTSQTAPSVTTTRDGNMVLVFGAAHTNVSWTFPAGLTERYDSANTAAIACGTMEQATAGSTGTFALATSAAARSVTITVALNVNAPVDVEADGVSNSDGGAELSYVRRMEALGETLSAGDAEATRKRAVELDGASLSDGSAEIQGGTVRVEADGTTLSDGEASIGLVHRVEADGQILSAGDAELSYVRYVEVDGATLSDGEAAVTRIRAVELDGASLSASEAEISLANRTFGHRLRLDVFSPAGSLVTRIPVVFGAEYRLGQDEVGEFSLSLPAADERVALLVSGQRLILYREGEGKVFSGIVGKGETVQDVGGGSLLAVTGASRARELVKRNTLTGTSYEGQTVSAIAADLLTGTGWAPGEIATDPDGVTILGIGKSYWEMLAEVATRKGWHIRENNLAATVDIGPFGESSGIVVRNIAQARGWSDQDLAVLPLTGIRIVEQQEDLVNQVVVLGGGEGPNALTLRYSTRTSPYTIKQGTDQRGNPYWYEDAASIAAHGLQQGPPVVFKDIIPLANSAGSFEAAANALYDMGAAWLRWHANTVESYQISFVGLRHYDHGAAVLNPGDTLRLQYRGYVAKKTDGTAANRVWRDIDAELHVLDLRRSFNEDGSDSWAVTVSTSDQRAPDDTALMAETYARLHSVETALRPYTVSDTVGPLRDSVDSTHPFKMQVTFDDNVTYLLKASLEILVRPVRSNTKSAASGGGQTSSEGGSHTHTINATTTNEENPKHGHEVCTTDNVVPWVTPSHMQQLVFSTSVNAGGSFGVFIGRNGTTGGGTTLFTTGGSGHTHSVNATTSASGGTHSHTVGNHTHALVYGIFEGPNPSNPDLRLEINGVDVTDMLGGPWDDDVTLDVTQFLVDETQQVLRQNHTIEVQSSELADVICHLRVIQTIVGVHPV